MKNWNKSAKYAIDAGAGFVETHAGNGYLFNQFIEPEPNQRTDQYGGSIENRSRLLLGVIDYLIANGFLASKIAVRILPYNTFQNTKGWDSEVNPIASYGYILSEFENLHKNGKLLAYVAVVEPTVAGNSDNLKVTHNTSWVSEIWTGPLLRGGAYLSETPDYSILLKQLTLMIELLSVLVNTTHPIRIWLIDYLTLMN